MYILLCLYILLQNRSLYDASKRGDLEEVKRLVNKKADVNWPNPDDVSRTHSISRAGIEMVINLFYDCIYVMKTPV